MHWIKDYHLNVEVQQNMVFMRSRTNVIDVLRLDCLIDKFKLIHESDFLIIQILISSLNVSLVSGNCFESTPIFFTFL